MPDDSAPTRGMTDDLDWLPPGVVERLPSYRSRDNIPSDQRCTAPALLAIRRAPDGRVVLVAHTRQSPFLALDPPDRDVEVLEAQEVFGRDAPKLDASQTDLAVCVLDGVLERVDRPAALLAGAWQRLTPGGVLILTVGAEGAEVTAGRWSFRRDDRIRVFPGQTLAAMLFHAGFEAPQFSRCGHNRLVVARRGQLPPPGQRPIRLSVIMPVYNERATFEKTIELVLAKEIPDTEIEVIVVESNSTDGTRESVLGFEGVPRVSVILEDGPRGKGHAVRRGLQAAQGDFILIQDADLEYDVDDYADLLEPLRHGETGFVLGMRTRPDDSWGMRRFGQEATMSHLMNFGHIVFLALFNLVYQQKLRDPFTMYKVFRRDCLHGIELECNRFDFDWELTAKLLRAGYDPLEIPVSYQSRSFAEGKKIKLLRDPLTWITACFRYRFSRLHTYN